MFQRDIVGTIVKRMNEPRRFMQIILGPRQTGKSTAVSQALDAVDIPYVFAEVGEHGESPDWIRAQWQQARNLIGARGPSALLVIDEVQYVRGWSDTVKALWDEDARSGIDLRVFLTGSSATLLKGGMNESLTGRFELIRCTHWTYAECREAFEYSLDDFLFFGAIPALLRCGRSRTAGHRTSRTPSSSPASPRTSWRSRTSATPHCSGDCSTSERRIRDRRCRTASSSASWTIAATRRP